MELIEKLGFDLKLLLAQIVNFFILFFVLKTLLYKPILNVLDKRKKMIEKNVEDTRKIEERLKQLEEEKKEILSKASKEAMAVLDHAKKTATEEHDKILAKAKKEITTLAERYRGQLAAEKTAIIKEAKESLAEMIISGSQKIIQKEFTKDDQKRLNEAISKELKSVK